jgi:monoamine oxidase
VKGGNDWIVRTLADRLADSIAMDAALEAVRVGPDGRYVCSVRGRSGSREVRATHLLLALPFTLLRAVRLDLELPPVKRLSIDTLGYGTNAKLMVGFAERTWRVRHGTDGSVFTDRPMQSSWETSRAQAGAAGILTNFTGGRHGVALGVGTPAEQAARLTSDIDALLLAARCARRHEGSPLSLADQSVGEGSYAGYRVGQWTSIGGVEAAPVGRLYFAGEHCSREAQGFMEGGCATGEEAAAAILQDLS